MDDFASVSRRAMTLRIELCGTSLCGAAIAAAGAGARGAGEGAAAGVAAAREPPFWAASISARTIRPFGPLPFSPDRSIPACDAMRRASGEAKTRSPAACPFGGGDAVAAGANEAAGDGADAGTGEEVGDGAGGGGGPERAGAGDAGFAPGARGGAPSGA